MTEVLGTASVAPVVPLRSAQSIATRRVCYWRTYLTRRVRWPTTKRRETLRQVLKSIGLVLALTSTVGVAAQAQGDLPLPLIDGAPWPATLDYPLKKIGISVDIKGSVLSAEDQESIEAATASHLQESLRTVAPEIEVFAMSELLKREGVTGGDPSIVAAYYVVTLARWPGSGAPDEAILGALQLSIQARHTNSQAPSFGLALFQSKPNRNLLLNVIQKVMSAYVTQTIVRPVKASLLR